MKERKLQKGFTIIETLVAITILAIAVTGPLTVASNGLFAAIHAKNQITAFYLAQEAIEFVRNKRDEATLSGIGWLSNITPTTCSKGNRCAIDVINDNFLSCGVSCPPLRFNQGDSYYHHGGGTDPDSIFTREVFVNEIVPDVEATVTVIISWSTGTLPKSFAIRENIFNWQQPPPPPCTGPVTLFQHTDFGGYSASFGVGTYTLAQLNACGVLDNDVSSLTVSSGYEVTLYSDDSFGGSSLVKTADDSTLVDDGWNDVMSSLEIELISSPLVIFLAPTLDSATLSGSNYLLTWSLPFGQEDPTGGYDIIIDGIDTDATWRTTATSQTISGLNTSVSHSFKIQAQYLQADPDQFPESNEEIVPPASPSGTITIDSVSTGFAAAASLTISHTVGSDSDRVLVVTLGIRDNNDTDRQINTITYGGTPLTLAHSIDETSQGHLAASYYLVAPSTGTADVVITSVGDVQVIFATVVSYTGVDQSSPIDSTAEMKGSGNDTQGASITTINDNAIIQDSLVRDDDGALTMTVASGRVERQNVESGSDAASGQSTRMTTTAGSYPMTWDIGGGGAENFAHTIVALKPAP